MLDDIESRSGHSIGIVDNPLYAEEEEGQTYSDLMAKEKEAEVRTYTCTWLNNVNCTCTCKQAELDVAPEKGQAFSINFGPPGDDEF